MAAPTKGLFERWYTLELATGRPVAAILEDLNTATGMNYKHNWPTVIAGRGYELERCPLKVRRYMMTRVLRDELQKLGIDMSDNKLDKLVFGLS